jgi:hypothetical protein
MVIMAPCLVASRAGNKPHPRAPPALVESVQPSAPWTEDLSTGRPIAGANGNLNPEETLACASGQSEKTSLGSRSFALVDRLTFSVGFTK